MVLWKAEKPQFPNIMSALVSFPEAEIKYLDKSNEREKVYLAHKYKLRLWWWSQGLGNLKYLVTCNPKFRAKNSVCCCSADFLYSYAIQDPKPRQWCHP